MPFNSELRVGIPRVSAGMRCTYAMSSETSERIESKVAALPLVDHHVHGALRDNPTDRADFERHIAETDRPGV